LTAGEERARSRQLSFGKWFIDDINIEISYRRRIAKSNIPLEIYFGDDNRRLSGEDRRASSAGVAGLTLVLERDDPAAQ
jgi:hypothetical protein